MIMNKTVDYQKLLKAMVTMGASLMENGAEVYRVEESIQRVVYSYGIKHADVFAIPNLVMVSLETCDGETFTKSRRIYSRHANFDKVIQLNDLARRLSKEPRDLDEVRQKLKSINKRKNYKTSFSFICYGLIAFFFSLLFGGTFQDAVVAAVAVYAGRIVCMQMEHFRANSFFVTMTASFIHSIMAYIMISVYPILHLDKIVMGTLMVLVPGVTFMTALRDIIARDLIAGLFEALEAIVIAVAIATGSALAIGIMPIFWEVL